MNGRMRLSGPLSIHPRFILYVTVHPLFIPYRSPMHPLFTLYSSENVSPTHNPHAHCHHFAADYSSELASKPIHQAFEKLWIKPIVCSTAIFYPPAVHPPFLPTMYSSSSILPLLTVSPSTHPLLLSSSSYRPNLSATSRVPLQPRSKPRERQGRRRTESAEGDWELARGRQTLELE
jgi:hypothetical protein